MGEPDVFAGSPFDSKAKKRTRQSPGSAHYSLKELFNETIRLKTSLSFVVFLGSTLK